MSDQVKKSTDSKQTVPGEDAVKRTAVESVEAPKERLVKVRLLDTQPRHFQGQHVYLVVYQNEGYLVPKEDVQIKPGNGEVYVNESVLTSTAFKLYAFEEEIKKAMPTVDSIREALWLDGAYDLNHVTRNNVRGKFPAVIKV